MSRLDTIEVEYVCPDCEEKTTWTLRDLIKKGTPVCDKCGCDMECPEAN